MWLIAISLIGSQLLRNVGRKWDSWKKNTRSSASSIVHWLLLIITSVRDLMLKSQCF